MLKELDMPLSISQIGTISKEDYFAAIPHMADEALADSCTKNNPRKVTRANVVELYKQLWY